MMIPIANTAHLALMEDEGVAEEIILIRGDAVLQWEGMTGGTAERPNGEQNRGDEHETHRVACGGAACWVSDGSGRAEGQEPWKPTHRGVSINNPAIPKHDQRPSRNLKEREPAEGLGEARQDPERLAEGQEKGLVRSQLKS